jgi:hypothetical protein
MNGITGSEYGAFDTAYDWFNSTLFEGKLPLVLVTLNRKAPRNLGYFSPERFSNRTVEGNTDEIALNPDNFTGRSDKLILSTLVHEMAHVWQFHLGKPSRNGYHNTEWGTKMDSIGLTPSNTGAPGGKRKGQQMDHYIVEGGPFDVACEALFAQGVRLNWQSTHRLESGKTRKKDKSKLKYTCPVCGANAWAKQGSELIHGTCMAVMESEMVEEEEGEEEGEE